MATDVFEAKLLPDHEKERLCQELLDEFGARVVNVTYKGEMQHGCVLPFGNHKNQGTSPTASLNYKKLTYRCLGCGGHGGLLWFIAVMRGYEGDNAKQARAWLNQEAGIGQVQDLAKLLEYFDALYKAPDAKPVIPTYNIDVLKPWLLIHPYLTDPINKKGRAIPIAAVKRMKLGYDQRRDRIIIPHIIDGTLVGWQARRMAKIDPDPTKYRNSPDFPKEFTIYNYDYLAPVATVVEAPLTVARHVLDIHMEATFGAALGERQLQLLAKHPTLVIWFDNDKAGWEATRVLISLLCRYTEVLVVNSPWAQDAGDMTTPDAQQLIADALPWSLWEPPTAIRCYIHQDNLWEDCPCPKK